MRETGPARCGKKRSCLVQLLFHVQNALPEPGWNPSASPHGKSGFLTDVKLPVCQHGIAGYAVLLRHGLGKFRQARIGQEGSRQGLDHPGRLMIVCFSEPVSELVVQGQGERTKPLPVSKRCARPEGAGMMKMRGPVRGLRPGLIQHRAEHLGAFQYHFHHMLIGVVSRTFFDVQVQHENIQQGPPDSDASSSEAPMNSF